MQKLAILYEEQARYVEEIRITVNIVEIELLTTLLWFIIKPAVSGGTAYGAKWEISVSRKTI